MQKSNRPADLDSVFRALADPVRRAMLGELAAGARGATKLARGFGISQPAISRHVRVLREAGLIKTHVKGRNHWCVLRAEGMKDAAVWVERYRVFWEGQLDALEAFAREQQAEHPAEGAERKARAPKRRGGRRADT